MKDISFDKEIIRLKKCNIIGVDPTEKSCQKYIRETHRTTFILFRKPLSHTTEKIKIYKNHNPEWVSESILRSHNMVSDDFYEAESTTLEELIKENPDVSLIKMDIEGSEYELIDNLKELRVPQVCIEFHHFCSEKNLGRHKEVYLKMGELGYKRFLEKPNSQQKYTELTFIHDEVVVSLPIVFLHRGNQDFIQYFLLKATETNPDSKVYLIGDNSNRHLGSLSGNIEWVDYGDCVSENSKLYHKVITT